MAVSFEGGVAERGASDCRLVVQKRLVRRPEVSHAKPFDLDVFVFALFWGVLAPHRGCHKTEVLFMITPLIHLDCAQKRNLPEAQFEF